MSTPKSSNTPDANAAGGTKSGKKKESNNFLLIGVLVIAVIIIVFGIFGGSSDDKKTVKKDTTATSNAKGNAPKVYEKSPQRKIERSEAGAVNSTHQDFSNMGELEYMTQPDTNIKMVKTPNGFVVADSPEGKKFIDDFNAYRQMQNPGTNQAEAQQRASDELLKQARQQADDQARALDEKVNDLSAQFDGLVGVIKKQNETISKLSAQIREIQPLSNNKKLFAQNVQEAFGGNAKKVLRERNNSLVADSVIGGKAFITDSNGSVHVVKVGDVIPGTTSIVVLIDESSKQVILKQ